jgi:hypothetical protein
MGLSITEGINIMVNNLQSRPQTALQVIGNGYRFWIRTFNKTFFFAFLIGIINIWIRFGTEFYTNPVYESIGISGTSLLFPYSLLNIIFETIPYTNAVTEPMDLFGALMLSMAFIVSLILNASMVYCIDATINQTKVTFDQAFYSSCKKIYTLIGVCFLSIATNIVGLIWVAMVEIVSVNYMNTMIVPRQFLLFMFLSIVTVFVIFSYLIVAVTNKGAVESIRESFRLISGNFWRTIRYFILMCLPYIFTTLLFIIFIRLLGILINIKIFDLPYFIVAIVIGFAVLYPLFISFLIMILYDLRNRSHY